MPYSPSLDVTNLDRSVDPCNDFYKFACGGWQKNNPIPADQASWSVYAKLANDNQQFLWGILEDDAKATNRTPVQQKVGDYFAACMNTSAIDALGDKPLLPGLARIDALKTRPEAIALVTTLHKLYPGTYFFNAGTNQDAVDSSTIIVEVAPGASVCPTATTTSRPIRKASKFASNTPPTSSTSSRSPARAPQRRKPMLKQRSASRPRSRKHR